MADNSDSACTVPEMVGNIAAQVRITMRKLRETLKPVEDALVKEKLLGVYGELKDLERTLGSLNSALTWSEHVGIPAVRTNESARDLREAVDGCWDTCKDIAVLVSSSDEDALEKLLDWSDEMPVRSYRETLGRILRVIVETANASSAESDLDCDDSTPLVYDEEDERSDEPPVRLLEALPASVVNLRLSAVFIPKPTPEVPLAPIEEDEFESEGLPSAVSSTAASSLRVNIQGRFDPLGTRPRLPPKDYYYNGDLVSPISPVSSLHNSPASTIFRSSSKSSHETVSSFGSPSTPKFDEGMIPLASEIPTKFSSNTHDNKQPDDPHWPSSLWTDKAYFFFPTVDHYTTPYEIPPPPPKEGKSFEGCLVDSHYVLTKTTTSSIRSSKRRYKVEFFSNGTSRSTIYSRNSSIYGRGSLTNTILQADDQWTFQLHNDTAAFSRQSISFLPSPKSLLPSFSTPSETIKISPLGRKELGSHSYAFARFSHQERTYICTVGFVDHGRLFTKIAEYRHSMAAMKPARSSARSIIDPDDADAERKYIKTVVSFAYVDGHEGKNYRNKIWVRKCMRENLETLLLLVQAHFGYVALKYAVDNVDKKPVPIVGGTLYGNESQRNSDGLSAQEKVMIAEAMPVMLNVEEPLVLSPVINQGPSGFVSSATYC